MFFKKKKKPVNVGNYKLNLQRDSDDSRDFKLRSHIVNGQPLPKSVDLRPFMPTVFSQGSVGSCTACGGCADVSYLINRVKGEKTTLSRMYLYNKERINDGTPLSEDSGSSVRQICKTLKKDGVCDEELFPYCAENFSKEPDEKANENAKKHRIKSYYRCETVYEIKEALAMGLPVLTGLAIYEDFYRTGKNGNIPTIDTSTPYLGGHLVLLVGYQPKMLSNKVKFILRNSWGKSIKTEDSWGYAFNNPSDDGFGDNGHGYIDEDNLMNILLDAWVITELE